MPIRVEKSQRAQSGFSRVLKDSWKNRIISYQRASDGIISLRLRRGRDNLPITGVYAPTIGHSNETEHFYKQLQDVIDKLKKNDKVIISGDLNARIGTETVDDLIGPHEQVKLNDNGEHLREFCACIKLRIKNSFFKRKDIHKFTWAERGSNSIIDYVIANKKTWLYKTDTREYRGAEVCSDHFLVLCKIRTPKPYFQKKIQQKAEEGKFEVQLLEQESIRKLYENRPEAQIKPRVGDVEIDCVNLREAVKQAARESFRCTKN
ncbi:hypothetical protein Cfor_04003 [Coptotermes formosanus]|uniref:Endonuclease/exonuclease/phosphatase domain-containing protein n=1 Tax=Coptotermes formosanus TaxID=36987 RepID=A0A6L2PLM3_COPFO|nr:hypothetical protein Cfor_04003 [Coptotermes formosanus]